MRKCHADEVPTHVIVLAEQCAEGVQFNCAQFLCNEFLTNCKEAQEKGNNFHYVWLLLSDLDLGRRPPRSKRFKWILGGETPKV